MYYRLLEKVKALKWITPIFDDLCEQFQHITMYKVYMDKFGNFLAPSYVLLVQHAMLVHIPQPNSDCLG
ncbi:unnamed protein product [Prunus armeniaca]|uniref:Uncharacterized protein n=1 Tax=Prunus armeniaca TaxID=36596 RepID=A0A6J5XVU9_PRUAR|nr:unnamed protein product [Prunus armeniaca]